MHGGVSLELYRTSSVIGVNVWELTWVPKCTSYITISTGFLLSVVMLAVNKMNASTKTSRTWKLDTKEDGRLEWWRTIAGASNVTTQKQTIHASYEKESSYQNIPVLLWNKTLTSTGIVALNQKSILLFSCVCVFLMCSKNKQDSCILYFELFLCIKMVQKACYCLEKTPFQILFLVPMLSLCKVAWLKLRMFIVCFVNGSIYSCNKVSWSSKCGRNST